MIKKYRRRTRGPPLSIHTRKTNTHRNRQISLRPNSTPLKSQCYTPLSSRQTSREHLPCLLRFFSIYLFLGGEHSKNYFHDSWGTLVRKPHMPQLDFFSSLIYLISTRIYLSSHFMISRLCYKTFLSTSSFLKVDWKHKCFFPIGKNIIK